MSIQVKIKQNFPLAPLSTFKIGGPAKYFLEAESKEDLAQAVEWAGNNKVDLFLLGGGSNVLINDAGVDGLVIKFGNKNINLRGERLECGAGAGLAQAGRTACSHCLSGLEWTVGIPGATVGGSVRGNAGAFGMAMAEIVETVEAFSLAKERFEFFSNKDCEFDYRESFFKHNPEYFIWSVVLKMKPETDKKIQEALESNLKFRENIQPRLPSAGSVFKNFFFEDLKEQSPRLAEYAEENGAVKGDKVGAGWLVDLMNLKGKKIGGAKISLEHGNFIINTGQATALDVIALISFVKQQVRDRFNVQLQEEIQYFGF